jgi:hypothetical protein
MDIKQNNIGTIAVIATILIATIGVFGSFFVRKVAAPANEADIPVGQVSTPSIDQSGQDLSSVVSETVTRNEYTTRLPHIDCATWSVSNDALLQAKPIVMGTYDIYEMPSCMVVVDTRGQRYATFGFRDFVHKSVFFKQVIGTSQSNLGYNVQVNESGLVVLKLWKLKADCSKYRNDAMCSNDETTFTQPLPWNASDVEWSRIGSIVEVASIDNFNSIPKTVSKQQAVVPMAQYFEVEELGFKFPIDSSMVGELTYAISSGGEVVFSSKSLAAFSTYCGDGTSGPIIGKIAGTPAHAEWEPEPGYFETFPSEHIKKFEGLFFIYVDSQSSCTDGKNTELESSVSKAVAEGFKGIVLTGK